MDTTLAAIILWTVPPAAFYALAVLFAIPQRRY